MTDVAVTDEAETIIAEPVVVETKKKKKKGKRYTGVTRDAQELGHAMAQANVKVADAVQIAMSEWADRYDKSGRKSKNGAAKDGMMNLSRSVSKGIKKAMKAPDKFLDELEDTKLYKKRFRMKF